MKLEDFVNYNLSGESIHGGLDTAKVVNTGSYEYIKGSGGCNDDTITTTYEDGSVETCVYWDCEWEDCP